VPYLRPVEDARHLPARVAGAVAGDFHHCADKFVVSDPPVIGPRDGTQLDAAILGLQRPHQFPAMREQAMLKIDRRQRRR
jgi:hypothetical protein